MPWTCTQTADVCKRQGRHKSFLWVAQQQLFTSTPTVASNAIDQSRMAEEAGVAHPSTLDLSIALASCLLQLAYPGHRMRLSLTSYILATLLKQTQYHTVFFGQFAAFLVLVGILTCFYAAVATIMIINTRIAIATVRKDIDEIKVINTGTKSETLALKNETTRWKEKRKVLSSILTE